MRSICTAVLVALVTVGGWPAADAKFDVVKCCPWGQVLIKPGQPKCIKDKSRLSHEFNVPKIVNSSGAYNFYSKDEYNKCFSEKPNGLPVKLWPKNFPEDSFNITKTDNKTVYLKYKDNQNETKFCLDELFVGKRFFYTAIFTTYDVLEQFTSTAPIIPLNFWMKKAANKGLLMKSRLDNGSGSSSIVATLLRQDNGDKCIEF